MWREQLLKRCPKMDGVALRSVLSVLAVDPALIGGIWLRGRLGPMHQKLMQLLAGLPLPVPLQKLSVNIGDDALFGGLDPAATLRRGRPILRHGVLDKSAVLVLPMAERCEASLSARLSQALDNHRHALIAWDEAAEDGEGLPAGLADRLGLFLDLDQLEMPDSLTLPTEDEVITARSLLPSVRVTHQSVVEVVRTCADLLILSTRAPMLALGVARLLAALGGRRLVEQADIVEAMKLTLSHRAAPFSDIGPSQTDADPPSSPPDEAADQTERDQSLPLDRDLVVEAIRTALPADLLEKLGQERSTRAARGAAGSGTFRVGNHRGRPMPSRRGKPGSHARVDLLATLRAAAPWQGARRELSPHRAGQALLVDSADIHIKRNKTLSDRVLIFAVDASGSAAVSRLGEAKGAVELLLSKAYSRRDHVALLTFRNQRAELLLPPTRSLVLTKNRLRGLPGGGGTPLPDALRLALETALRAKGRGMTPTIAILTDGRGNIALDGQPDRSLAENQAFQMASAIRVAGLSALIIDVGQRAQPRLAELANRMGARYLALPRANAGKLASVLGASLEG